MLTLAVVAVLVIGLAAYLIAVALTLIDARKNVAGIADALEAVARDTAPLEQQLVTMNGALSALAAGLETADRRLGRVAVAFRL
jgi:hypothetical protein